MVRAATLVYNTPDLAEAMRLALPGVLVTDNGSDPPVPGPCLRLEKNLYFSGGWNAAMRELAGEDYVWMLNSDVSGDLAGALAQLLRVAEHSRADVVSPAFRGCFHRHMRPGQGARQVRWVDWVAPLVRVGWWRGFDETFPGWGADIDLCFRARGMFIVDRRVALVHEWGTTVRRTGDRTMYAIEAARRALFAKHGPAVRRFAPSFFRR